MSKPRFTPEQTDLLQCLFRSPDGMIEHDSCFRPRTVRSLQTRGIIRVVTRRGIRNRKRIEYRLTHVGRRIITALDVQTSERLRTCPFCGSVPIVQPWHGGAITKRMVACDNDRCAVAPSVTGETLRQAVMRWNVREMQT